MPESSGKLSDAEIRSVEAWFKEKWKITLACPVSGKTQWQIANYLATTPIYTPGSYGLPGRSYAFVQVLCPECGYSMFFNAIRLGLLPPAKEAEHA